MRYSALTLFFATILVLLPVSASAAPNDNYLNSRDVPYRMVRRRAQGLSPMAHGMINRRVSDKHEARGLLSDLFGGDNGKDATPVNAGTGNNTTNPGTGDTTTNNSTTTTNDPNTGGSTNTTDTGNTNKSPQNPNNPDNGAASVSSQAVSSIAAASQSTPSASSTSSAATASTPSPSATPNLSLLPTTTGSFTDPFASSSTATSSATDAAAIAPGVENKSAFSHTTIVTLIVIASCVAAVAIIWTAIRKWKFSPSRQFEDRLQRIDWEPSNEHGNQLSAGLGGGFRHGSSTRDMSERRTSHGSFGSSDRNHPDDGAASSNVAPDLPAHDFTAGPAAPSTTYANLARGPSLNRGASLNRGNTSVTRGPSYGRAYYGGYGTQQPANTYGYGY